MAWWGDGEGSAPRGLQLGLGSRGRLGARECKRRWLLCAASCRPAGCRRAALPGACCAERVAPALCADRGVRAGAAQGEIHNVIASLRLGGASSVGLLQDFKALHDSLCAVSSRTAITEIDTLSYFEPFLALLQSEQTSGVVTHVRPRPPSLAPARPPASVGW